jgi:hypothetical protein
MLTNGLVGKVKLATVDVSENTKMFVDNGTIVYIAGGQYNTIMTAFAALYNYMYDGTRIIPDPGKAVYAPYLEIKTSSDYETYAKLVEGPTPVYKPEEIAAMIKGFNPSFTPDDFVKVNQSYSLEDLAKRHADLLK